MSTVSLARQEAFYERGGSVTPGGREHRSTWEMTGGHPVPEVLDS